MSVRVGDVYAVKLGRASYGVIQIVWVKAAWKHTSMVFLDWFGAEVPKLADVATAPLLRFQHPELAGEVGWLRNLNGAKVPPAYARLGKLPVSKAARALPLGDTWVDKAQRHRTTDWRAVPDTLRRELAYRTDPEAALAARLVPGELVAITTEQGIVVSRVLYVTGRVEEEPYAVRHVLAVFEHPFTKMPTLAQAAKTLALPGLKKPHEIRYTSQAMPEEAVKLGVVPLKKGERERVPAESNEHAGWPWSDKHARRHTKVIAARTAAPKLTLATVKPAELFKHWKKASAEDCSTSRSIIATLVTTLREVTAPAKQRAAILKAVSAFNKTAFIETFEREDICGLLSALGQSAGLRAEVVDRLVEARRDF